jgi:hypothetical protein
MGLFGKKDVPNLMKCVGCPKWIMGKGCWHDKKRWCGKTYDNEGNEVKELRQYV